MVGAEHGQLAGPVRYLYGLLASPILRQLVGLVLGLLDGPVCTLAASLVQYCGAS